MGIASSVGRVAALSLGLLLAGAAAASEETQLLEAIKEK